MAKYPTAKCLAAKYHRPNTDTLSNINTLNMITENIRHFVNKYFFNLQTRIHLNTELQVRWEYRISPVGKYISGELPLALKSPAPKRRTTDCKD